MSNPQTAGSNPEHKLRAQKPPGALRVVLWEQILPMLQSLFRQAGWSLQIDGAESAGVGADGRLQFKVNSSASSAPAQGLDVSSAGKVTAATVMGVMPTIGGTSLDDGTPPLLTIPSSGTRYIVVTVTGTFTLKGSTFVLPTFSAAPTVTIAVETTNPGYAGTHNISTGTFKFLLATFVDGVKTGQNGHGPVSAEICDSLNQDAKANLNLTWASA